jgi:hypothetical protein
MRSILQHVRACFNAIAWSLQESAKALFGNKALFQNALDQYLLQILSAWWIVRFALSNYCQSEQLWQLRG